MNYSDDGTPIGPGFFIFFHYEVQQTGNYAPTGKYKPLKSDDEETIELIQVLFSFLEGDQCPTM